MKRAVIYLRVSTDQQAQTDYDPEGFSLPAQRQACHRKAEQLGAEVVQEYLDCGESAKTADRPRLQAMLERISQQRDIHYVIVDKLDRFARNRRDDANLVFELRMAGAQLVSVKENIDDTPSGKLLHGSWPQSPSFTRPTWQPKSSKAPPKSADRRHALSGPDRLPQRS
jgi:site-specific DNA recombinase